MMKLPIPQIFLKLLPVRKSIISVALHPAKVQQILTRNLVPEIVGGSGWSAYRYTGSFEDNVLFLKGPFGHKRWCLWTKVEIVFVGGGMVLKIHQRFATGNIILLIGVFLFYISFALFSFQLSSFFPFLCLQVAFLYGAILVSFNYEASQIKTLLERLIQENKSGEAQ